VLHTIDTVSTPYYDETTHVEAEGLRYLFLEPKRDTAGALIEPYEWELKRISYGSYGFPNRGGDIPAIYQVVLTPQDGEPDTILYGSPDTSFTGHAMNRFRSPDSLLEYPAGKILNVAMTLIPIPFPTDSCLFFASCGGGNRVQLIKASGNLVVSGDEGKIVNLYFESVVPNSYYYINPSRGYNATVWLIPIRIGGAQ
jgi:hypothetical protein